MENIRKRALIEIMTSPVTVISITIGVSLLMLSSIIDRGWGLTGFLCCLFGIGAAVTNAIFNFDKISKNIVDSLNREKEAKINSHLDVLESELSSSREHRALKTFRIAKFSYMNFKENIKDGKILTNGLEIMIEQINKLFDCCIQRLKEQHDVCLAYRKANDDHAKSMLVDQRDSMLDEIDEAVNNMTKAIDCIKSLGLKASDNELSELSGVLTRQLEIAKATDEAVSGIDQDDVVKRYAEYQN